MGHKKEKQNVTCPNLSTGIFVENFVGGKFHDTWVNHENNKKLAPHGK